MLCVISHTNDCIIYWCCLSSSESILSLDNIGLYDTHCHAGWQAVNHPSLCSILPDGKPKPQSMVWDPCDWFVGPNVTCLLQIQSPGSPVRNTQQSNDPEPLQSLAWIKAKESNYWLSNKLLYKQNSNREVLMMAYITKNEWDENCID